MIDILYNKLKVSDISDAEWKDVNPELFKKHSQYSLQSLQSLQSLHNVIEPIKEVVNELPEITKVTKVAEVTKVPEVTEVTDVPLSQPQKSSPILAKNNRKETKDTKETKDMVNKPLNIIISETTSFNNSTEYIKEALITMISKDEFTKVFGQTKCAEIMSGVVNNRWNKSTALFISFLLDKEVYYNDKVIIYNKEKNKGRITITKT
jgi:hypothetical protein